MNDNFNNNDQNESYDSYGFSTPIDPAPIEPEDMEPAQAGYGAETASAGLQFGEPEATEPMFEDPELPEGDFTEPEPVNTDWSEPEKSEPVDTGWSEPEKPEPVNTDWSEPKKTEPEVSGSESVGTETYRSDSMYAYSFRKAEPKQEEPKKPEVQPKKKKSSGGFKKFLACAGLAVVFGLVSGGVFLGVTAAGIDLLGIDHEEQPLTEIPKVEVAAPKDGNTGDAVETSASAGNLTVAQVAEQCMPAMVAITNKSIIEIPNYFGFGSQNYESASSGSGIIVDQNEEELLIATNNHVVSGASTLTVCFVDDTLVEAMIKGTDAENDLAIVSVKLSDIPSETLSAIKVIQIGDSDSLAVGDQVVAIGNALGYGQSVSSGWISAMNREVTIDNITLNLIQTDAAINPGNSGGALLNMRGELIGINESKYADTYVEGMGYAIPVSTATPILSELMSKQTRYKVDEEQASYMGITCKDISADFAMMYGVPTGVYVDSVEENGPAAAAGIKKGDIITTFDGTKLTSYTELVSLLEYYAAGEIVEVIISRADDGEYKELELIITLGARNSTDFLQENE